MEPKYIVAIEIGSSHIKIAIGTVDNDGVLSLLGIESDQAVEIVRYGNIQNVDDVSNRIKSLIRKLENHSNVSPRKIKGVYISVGGRSTMTTTRQVVRHYNDEVEITAKIIDQIKDEAKQMGLSDRTVLDVSPREFVVDNLECTNPVGTIGTTLRADMNLITCRPKVLRNFDIVLTERQQLSIKGTFVRQNVIADFVLNSDERALGCMLVDFGAETTTVSVYKNSTLRYLATLPIGSRNITRDIMSLKMTEDRAEELKRVIGDAINADPDYRRADFDGDAIEVNDYIRARAGEIALNIVEQAKFAGYKLSSDLPGGIILVGGGAKLKQFTTLLSEQSGVKVRLGNIPSTVRITDTRHQGPDNIDIIALLSAAAKNPVECTEIIAPIEPEKPTEDPFKESEGGPRPRGLDKKQKNPQKSNGLSSIFKKIKDWSDKSFNDDDDDEDEDDDNGR
jgi:cell division protein FtsA